MRLNNFFAAFAFVLLFSSNVFASIISDQKSYFPLNESSGNVVDVISSVSCSATGSPTYEETGKAGFAVNVSNNNYFGASDPSTWDNEDNLTVCAWINAKSLTSGGIVGKKENGASPTDAMFSLQMSFNTNGYGENLGGYSNRPLFQIRDDSGSYWTVGDNSTISTGTWAHVCGVSDAGDNTISFYRDGVLQNVVSVATLDIDPNNANFYIGNDGYGNEFDGTIDEIRIYTRALNEAEIETIYNETAEILNPGSDALQIDLTYDSTIYENSYNTIEIMFNHTTKDILHSYYISSSCNITYNGTSYECEEDDVEPITKTTKNFTCLVPVSLQTVNNSNLNFNLTYFLNYNDTDESPFTTNDTENGTTSTYTQNVLYAYIFSNDTQNSVLEGEHFTAKFNVTKFVDNEVLSVSLLFDGSTYNMSKTENSTFANFSKTQLYYSGVSGDSITKSLNYTLLIENGVNNSSVERNNSEDITVYSFNVTNCSGTNEHVFLTVYTRDEDSTALVNTSMVSVVSFGTSFFTRNKTISHDSNDTHHFCMTPNTSAYFNVNANITYSATGYASRDYFLDIVANTSETESINLYIANTSDTDLWTIKVQEDGQALEGARVKILRYYPLNDTAFLVAERETNSDGQIQTYLYSSDVKYNFIVTYEEIERYSSSPAYLTALATEEKLIVLNIDTIGNILNYQVNDVTADCTTNSTLATCTVNDENLIFDSYSFKVVHVNDLNGSTTVCSSSSSSNTASFQCNVSEYNSSGSIYAQIVGNTQDYSILLAYSVYGNSDYDFGSVGEEIAWILVFFSIFAGITITNSYLGIILSPLFMVVLLAKIGAISVASPELLVAGGIILILILGESK